MAIWHEQKPNCFIIHIDEPDLTEHLLDRMRQILTVAFLHQRYQLILDFSACSMIDSYFIGLLISTHRELRDLGGELKCAGVSGQIAHAFDVIRLNQVIGMYQSVEEAAQAFSERAQSPPSRTTAP